MTFSEAVKNDPRKDEIKICTKCGEHKPRGEFYPSNVKSNGTVVRTPFCAKCGKELQTTKRRSKGIESNLIPQIEKDGITLYQCNECLEYKPRESYPKDRHVVNTIAFKRPCKSCRKTLHRFSRTRDVGEFLSDNQLYENDKRYGSIFRIKRGLFNLAKNRAKTLNIPFDITIDDISIPKSCPILNIPLIPGIGAQSPNSPSIDRIVPNLGYTKNNIAVISYRANAMKNDASNEELLAFSKNILSYLKVKR